MTCYQIWSNAADGEKRMSWLIQMTMIFEACEQWMTLLIRITVIFEACEQRMTLLIQVTDFRGSENSAAYSPKERPLELLQHKDSSNREQPSTDGIYWRRIPQDLHPFDQERIWCLVYDPWMQTHTKQMKYNGNCTLSLCKIYTEQI